MNGGVMIPQTSLGRKKSIANLVNKLKWAKEKNNENSSGF
jgi:hypothetical protein